MSLIKIKKKDYNNLTLALRALEKAHMLLERAQQSSPIVSFAINNYAEIQHNIAWSATAIHKDLNQFTTK